MAPRTPKPHSELLAIVQLALQGDMAMPTYLNDSQKRGLVALQGIEEQLEALKADNERLRSRLTYLLIDPNPLTPEELENLREIVGLPRVPNPAKERS